MIEGYIETHPVFTRQELMDSCGDTQNNANLLYRAKRAGKVASIARGVYASNTGRYRANEASPYAVAEKLGTDVVLAYNSALSLLVGTHDVTSRVVFYTNSTERRIKWGGHEYVGYPKPDGVSTKERRLPDGTSVRFTDKEQNTAFSISAGYVPVKKDALTLDNLQKAAESVEGASENYLVNLPATLDTIEAGEMTGDLALITTLPNPVKLSTRDFILAIAKRLAA